MVKVEFSGVLSGIGGVKLVWNPHGAASCRFRDPAALTGRRGHPTSCLASGQFLIFTSVIQRDVRAVQIDAALSTGFNEVRSILYWLY
jgi:hypothetical protein